MVDSCNILMRRWQHCCNKHWFKLSADLQQRIKAAKPEEMSALKIEVTEYIKVEEAAEIESHRHARVRR